MAHIRTQPILKEVLNYPNPKRPTIVYMDPRVYFSGVRGVQQMETLADVAGT